MHLSTLHEFVLCNIFYSFSISLSFFKKLVKLIVFRRIVLINQPLVIVVSHKIIVHNLELIINSNIF